MARNLSFLHSFCEMKGQLNIILGNSDDAINDFFSRTVEKVVKKKYRLNIDSFFYIEDIKNHAKKYSIDLFVIVVNNVILRQENPSDNRIEKVLEFIRELNDTHNRPIIALYGWPDDPHFPDKTEKAGQIFVLRCHANLKI